MSNLSNDDERILIDFLLGHCAASQEQEVRDRLGRDADFQALCESLRNTFSTVGLLPEVQPPQDLVARTLARIRSAKQIDALLAREESSRRRIGPAFTFREVGVLAAAVVVLAVIFVPSIRQAKRRMLVSECASNQGQIGAALSTYAGQNNEYLPIAADRRYQWLPADGRPAGPIVPTRFPRASFTRSPVARHFLSF